MEKSVKEMLIKVKPEALPVMRLATTPKEIKRLNASYGSGFGSSNGPKDNN